MNIFDILVSKQHQEYKAYDILKECLKKEEFYNVIKKGVELGYVRGLSQEFLTELDKLNIMHPARPKNFSEYLKLGLNIGNCTNTSKRISYALPYCQICGGTNKFLIGTQNSVDGSHTWISYEKEIIDPSFMIIIDEEYANEMGYVEEHRLDPTLNPGYNNDYKFANDRSIK